VLFPVRKNKKGAVGTDTFTYLVIGVFAIVAALLVFIFFKGGLGIASELTGCNTKQMKCACFFSDDKCPTETIQKSASDQCPPAGTTCETSILEEQIKKDDPGLCCRSGDWDRYAEQHPKRVNWLKPSESGVTSKSETTESKITELETIEIEGRRAPSYKRGLCAPVNIVLQSFQFLFSYLF